MVALTSTAESDEILGFARQLQEKAAKSGLFAFPPLIDVKLDQPQSEIVLDREKVAAMGLSLQQVGQDLAVAVGGNFVNRFSVAGRSYKVIPQLLRTEGNKFLPAFLLVGGMVIGTAFTLFFVPAIYVLIARDHRAAAARDAVAEPAAAA